jgi:arsenite oxidase small subunit
MKRCDALVDAGRRAFFARTAAVAAGVTATAALPSIAAKAAPSLARVTYPSTRLANVKDLTVNQPMDISYPDQGQPGGAAEIGQPG